MNDKNEKIVYILIAIIFILALIGSVLLKKDLIIFACLIILMLEVIIYSLSNDKRLMTLLLLGFLLYPMLGSLLGVLSYIPHFLMLIIVLKLFIKTTIKGEKLKIEKKIILIIMLLILMNLLGLIYSRTILSPILLLYAFMKKFAFVFMYIYFMNLEVEQEFKNKIIKFIYWYSMIQFPIIAVQYYMGVDRDNISGLFGNNATAIAFQVFLLILIVLLSLGEYIDKKRNYIFFILIMMFCALAEVKIGFIIAPAIYLVYTMLSKKSIKTLLRTAIIILACIMIYNLFVELYPRHDFIRNQKMTSEYLTKSLNDGSINRFGYMVTLENTMLTDNVKKMIGTGLGSANPSESQEILRGNIYKEYGYLKYHVFFMPYSIIENGVIGTILYILVYLIILMRSIVIYFKTSSKFSLCNILIIISTLLLIVYSNSLNSFLVSFVTWFLISNNIDKENLKTRSLI